jgi:hypothetical protein
MTGAERLIATIKFYALAYDDASPGSRSALACCLDAVALEIADEYLRHYCFGLADGLRRYSPARGSRSQEIN